MNQAPDYSQMCNWAAWPGYSSTAEIRPPFLKNEIVLPPKADVFFIHPTTYLCRNTGNCNIMVDLTEENRRIMAQNDDPLVANIHDTALNRFTDRTTIRSQASVFNASCQIYAPRYRQVHVKAFFLQEDPMTKQAFDLAYSDVCRAFEKFIEVTEKRPFFIAGHSQGSLHGLRLLEEYVADTPLAYRLVAAYLPGIALPKAQPGGLALLTQPDAIGGVVGWRTFQRHADTDELKTACPDTLGVVNPISWTGTSDIVASVSSCGMDGMGQLLPGGIRAQICKGVLMVELPDDFPIHMRAHANLHLYDYSLFWISIRKNIARRLESWQTAY